MTLVWRQTLRYLILLLMLAYSREIRRKENISQILEIFVVTSCTQHVDVKKKDDHKLTPVWIFASKGDISK